MKLIRKTKGRCCERGGIHGTTRPDANAERSAQSSELCTHPTHIAVACEARVPTARSVEQGGKATAAAATSTETTRSERVSSRCCAHPNTNATFAHDTTHRTTHATANAMTDAHATAYTAAYVSAHSAQASICYVCWLCQHVAIIAPAKEWRWHRRWRSGTISAGGIPTSHPTHVAVVCDRS